MSVLIKCGVVLLLPTDGGLSKECKVSITVMCAIWIRMILSENLKDQFNLAKNKSILISA